MNIQANNALNPEMNLGQLLQMLTSAGENQALSAGMNADVADGSAESGNLFCQILSDKLASLLQSGSLGEMAAQKIPPVDLGKKISGNNQNTLGELLQQIDSFLMGQLIPGLKDGEGMLSGLVHGSEALSDVHGEPAADESTYQQMFHGSPESTNTAGSYFMDPKNQGIDNALSALLSQKKDPNGNSMTASASSAGIRSENPALANADVFLRIFHISGEPDTAGKPLQVMSDVNLEAGMPPDHAGGEKMASNDGFQSLTASRQERPDSAMQAVLDASLKSQKGKEAPVSNVYANPTDFPEHAGKEIKVQQSTKTTQAEMVERPLAGYEANESHLNKTGIPFKNTAVEKDNRQSLSDPLSMDVSSPEGGESKDTSSAAKPAVSAKEALWQSAAGGADGKGAALAADSAIAADKIKTSYKAPSIPTEKVSESNASNLTSSSGALPLKTSIGDVTPSSIITRVAAEFRENLMGEGGRVKIILNPPSLGTVEMDVSVQNSKVRVLLTAENRDVQRMLSGNLDSLKGSLQTQGLTIERCDVMMQDRREEYSQGFNGQQAFQHDQSAREGKSSRETLDNQPPEIKVVPNIQKPLSRPLSGDSESISLFA